MGLSPPRIWLAFCCFCCLLLFPPMLLSHTWRHLALACVYPWRSPRAPRRYPPSTAGLSSCSTTFSTLPTCMLCMVRWSGRWPAPVPRLRRQRRHILPAAQPRSSHSGAQGKAQRQHQQQCKQELQQPQPQQQLQQLQQQQPQVGLEWQPVRAHMIRGSCWVLPASPSRS